MLAILAPLACTAGPVVAMVLGGYYATRGVRPENRS
jgi:hypothetical protein